jgi:predicted alpha/beta-fold hydrolase
MEPTKQMESENFKPICGIKSAMLQTIVSYAIPGKLTIGKNSTHKIPTTDGDQLLVHLHKAKTPTNRVIILIHGFTGCAQSKYALRLTPMLLKQDFHVLRVNLRGAGDSTYTCKRLYHSGKTEDIKLILDWLNLELPQSKQTLVGYSLGGNVSIKACADLTSRNLDSVIAVSTPLELKKCTMLLMQKQNQIFNKHFVTRVVKEVKSLHHYHKEVNIPYLNNIKSVYEFDEVYTSKMNGFKDADDYYSQCSSFQFLSKINHPTLLIHALDDPFIARSSYLNLPKNMHLSSIITNHGGHLGWLANPFKSNFRWMDNTILTAINSFHKNGAFKNE